MAQQWLAVIGLVFDFAGFVLLLIEWWLNYFNEEHQLVYEKMLERDRNLRQFASQNTPEALKRHMETAGRLQDDMSISRARAARNLAMRRRKTAFVISAIFIVLGFVLQLMGNIPGCCSSFGITPQG